MRVPTGSAEVDNEGIGRPVDVSRGSAWVALVGGVAVGDGDREVSGGVLGARRSRLILAALACTGSDGLGGRELAERVWVSPPQTWSSALRSALVALRSALEPIGLGGQRLIETTPTGWRLRPGVRVDFTSARAAVDQAEAELLAGRPDAATAVLEAARPVLAGRILVEDDREWLDHVRAEHARAASRGLAAWAEAAIRQGRWGEATDAAEQLIATNPIGETGHRLLIRSLAGAGDRAGAIRAFESCRSLLAEELGVDPAPETAALYLEVLKSGSAGANSLPSPPSNGFFGRHRELRLLAEQLREPGVVALVGQGGVGKSRLALHAVIAAGVAGPVHWIPVGDLHEPALVPSVLAQAIGIESAANPLDAAIQRLAPTGGELLVLDGCEAVLDGVVAVVVALLESVPGIRILATSRRRLGVPGERRLDLDPLPVPAFVSDDLARCAAVQLIADRVALRGGRLLLNQRNSEPVRWLAQRCGGNPLALELAAAQLATIAVGDLLDSLPIAADDAVDVLDELLEQNYDALDPDTATLFRAWGAVQGRLPLALIRGIVNAIPAGRLARLLAELVNLGLLTVEQSGPRWRYEMDDRVHEFAAARLAAAGNPTAPLEGLAARLRDILPPDPRTPPTPYRAALLDAADGFRSVFAAALNGRLPRQTGLELAFRLHRFWATTGLAEGRHWLGRLLDQPGDPGRWGPLAAFAAGYLAYWAGDTTVARVQLERAAAALRGHDDGFASRALVFAAGIADDMDEPRAAMRHIHQAIALARRTHDPNLLVTASMGVASLLAERGDPAAVDYIHAALAICREQASADQLNTTLATAAMVAWQVGDITTANQLVEEGAPVLDGPPRIARVILATAAAGCAFQAGGLDQAAHWAESAIRDATGLGVHRELPLALALSARIALARGDRKAAREATLRCLDAVQTLDFRFPTAIALETASQVTAADPDLGTVEQAALRAPAQAIRAAGDRPAPVGLRLPPLACSANDIGPDALAESIATARRLLRPPA